MASIKTTKRIECLLTCAEAVILQGILRAMCAVLGHHEVRVIMQPKDGNWALDHEDPHWEVYVKTPTKKLAYELYDLAGPRVSAIIKAASTRTLPEVPAGLMPRCLSFGA